MRKTLALFSLLSLSACLAPEIADWPPTAPPVDQAVIDRYVDRYTDDYKSPNYTKEDVDALVILNMRKFRAGDNGVDDIEKLRREQEEIRAGMARDNDPTVAPARDKGEINAIERRIDRRFESIHDRKFERLKAGI